MLDPLAGEPTMTSPAHRRSKGCPSRATQRECLAKRAARGTGRRFATAACSAPTRYERRAAVADQPTRDKRACVLAIAKQIPCAGRIIAVLTPSLRRASSPAGCPGTRVQRRVGLDEVSISRRSARAKYRPSALTTPAVTVVWNPRIPGAIANWPTRIVPESPSLAGIRSGGHPHDGGSVSGSSINPADACRPSSSVTSSAFAMNDVAVGQQPGRLERW